jgi:hypothetical protein
VILYHGTSPESAETLLAQGFDTEAVRKHDVGDWGWGIYLTDSLPRARSYGTVLEVDVDESDFAHIKSPYFLDGFTDLDPETPAEQLFFDIAFDERRDMLTVRGGNRERVAREVRDAFLHEGYSGIYPGLTDAMGTKDVVVFDPDAIRSIRRVEPLQPNMDRSVASAIMEAYPRRKMKLVDAVRVARAWLEGAGLQPDRWGNYKTDDTHRFKITKQRLQRQQKSHGDWRNTRSTPLLEAALNLVKKAATELGDEAALAKVSGAKVKRAEASQARAAKVKEEQLQREVMAMVAKVASAEMPDDFAHFHDTGNATPAFQTRYNSIVNEVQALRRLGKPPSDQALFSSFAPPLAPLLMELSAQWVEEVRGVPYTVTVAHSDPNTATITIGHVGSMGIGTQVDPLRGTARPTFEQREGDAYLTGWVKRSKTGPIGALFLIQSQEKKQGAGSRLLDLWCNLMDSYGVPAWVAQAVGDEGEAFLDAKVRAGRLERAGRDGPHHVMRCIGGPEGRQPQLPGLTPNADGRYDWNAKKALAEWRREAKSNFSGDVRLPPSDEPNPLYWLWKRYGRDRRAYGPRDYAVSAYAWAVPSPKAIQDIVAASEGYILEIGSGNGYWARQLSDAGADVIATDPYAPEDTFYPVESLKAAAAASMFKGRTLLLVWPPYAMSVAYDALRAFEKAGGTDLIYVGEGSGGCTGDAQFHRALGAGSGWFSDEDEEPVEELGWELVKVDTSLPSWGGISDSVYYYSRDPSRVPA